MYSVLYGKTLVSGATQRSNLVTLHTANSNNQKSQHVSAAAEPGPARHEPEGMGTLSGRSLGFGGPTEVTVPHWQRPQARPRFTFDTEAYFQYAASR
jgi:hypothetical protein